MTREEKYAWMRGLQAKKADALRREREQQARERADAKAAIAARASVDTAAAITGFTWGRPLAPRTRDQVKRACAWHKRKKRNSQRVSDAGREAA